MKLLIFLTVFFLTPTILFGQDAKNKQSQLDTLFKSKESAIKYAEPILFKAFGKRQTLSEKPYLSNLKEGIWTITGSLHSQRGGTFLIVFSSLDGKVIKLEHGQ